MFLPFFQLFHKSKFLSKFDQFKYKKLNKEWKGGEYYFVQFHLISKETITSIFIYPTRHK